MPSLLQAPEQRPEKMHVGRMHHINQNPHDRIIAANTSFVLTQPSVLC